MALAIILEQKNGNPFNFINNNEMPMNSSAGNAK